VETLPKLDGVVFVSDFMRQELYQRIPSLKRVEATIIPNFLIDPGEPKNVMIKADLINIGSLEQRKNQSYLLEIIAALRDLGTTLTLTIIGDGPDRAKLEEKCKALHLNELVTFSGFVEKASEHIIYHRACIHVATIENLPMTLIESLAHGKPIFAAPVGGIREILLDGKVGINLPLDDAKNAAHLIINAIKSTDWMNEAAIAARQCFLNDYVADISANRLLKFLLQQLEAL
jgi:glycosyltransferase involved in cell wall biosynthesis